MSLKEYTHSPASNVRTINHLREHSPYHDTDDEPARQAFNDLAAITTRGHSWLAKTLEERYLRLYTFGAWAVGMPQQAEVKPRKTALVVMNAGQGIGLSLSLDFAEAGYTVFGLVHQDHAPLEDGSLGKLVFFWQQRRAAILSRRARNLPTSTFLPLGTVIPIPFAPLSPLSQHKVRQTILAYCSAQSLRFHAVILTPVFAGQATPLGNAKPYVPVGLPPHPTPNPYQHDLEPEWERPIEVTEDEPHWNGALHPNPQAKHSFYETGPASGPAREGSYISLSVANQDLIERAVQREATEQLIVAQTFVDFLIPGAHSIDGSPGWVARTQRRRAARNRRYRLSPLPPIVEHHQLDVVEDDDDDDDDDDDETEESKWGLGSMIGYATAKAWSWVPRFGRLRTKMDPELPRGGKLIWLTGCSEASFASAQGLSGPMDAARHAMGKTLSMELSKLGVHVSVVSTGPLDHRASGLANLVPQHAEWDARTKVTAQSDTSLIKNHHSEANRVRFLARLSALWAIDDDSCFWIVRKAVEARYPKRTYTLGLDLVAQKAAGYVPDSIWQLSSWVLYERLGGRRCESWLLDYDQGVYWTWLPDTLSRRMLGWLSGYATRVKDKRD